MDPDMKTATAEATLGSTPPLSPLANLSSVRAISISAGDLSTSVMREVTQIMRENGKSQVKALSEGIKRLQRDNHVSALEAEDLNTVVRLVLGATRDKADVTKAALEVNQIYHKMITSSGGPVAIAIASAANASLNARALPAVSSAMAAVPAADVVITPGSTGAGAVIGGVIGGVVGGIVSGGLGAGVGAAIGAAAGSAIGWCNENGK